LRFESNLGHTADETLT